MQDSTRRSIRTALDVVIAVLGAVVATLAVPGLGESITDLIEHGPGDAVGLGALGAIMAALVALVSKVRNALEDAGAIPAIVKGTATVVADEPIPAERINPNTGGLEGDPLALEEVQGMGDTRDLE